MKIGDRVEVEWRDSASRGGWGSIEHHQQDRKVGPIRSIGYLLSMDEDVIQLYQSMSMNGGQVTDIITIPKENVVWTRRLKTKRSKKWERRHRSRS